MIDKRIIENKINTSHSRIIKQPMNVKNVAKKVNNNELLNT